MLVITKSGFTGRDVERFADSALTLPPKALSDVSGEAQPSIQAQVAITVEVPQAPHISQASAFPQTARA